MNRQAALRHVGLYTVALELFSAEGARETTSFVLDQLWLDDEDAGQIRLLKAHQGPYRTRGSGIGTRKRPPASR